MRSTRLIETKSAHKPILHASTLPDGVRGSTPHACLELFANHLEYGGDDAHTNSKMTVEIEHHDRNDDELPTTEEIIGQLQDRERDLVDDADAMDAIEGDVEIYHDASDGHVILRYRLTMGWDMDCDFGDTEGKMMDSDELQSMTNTKVE